MRSRSRYAHKTLDNSIEAITAGRLVVAHHSNLEEIYRGMIIRFYSSGLA